MSGTARGASHGAARGQQRSRALLAGATALGLVFLYAPLLLSIVYSFNVGVGGRQTARFTGLTLANYASAWNDASIRAAVVSGVEVGLAVMVIATALGTVLGFVVVRHPRAWVRRVLAGLVTLLLIVPEVVIAVSFLQMATDLDLTLGYGTMVVALTPMTIALVAFVVRASVLTLPAAIEDAARDLGASNLQVLGTIVLPQIVPAILVGAVLSFTMAFDNLVIATFLSTPDVTTLAVYLYSSLNYGTTPTVYAATSAIFAFTLVMLALAGGVYVAASRRKRTRPA